MKRKKWLFTLLLAAAPALAVAPLQPGDFAYGMRIEADGAAPFYEVSLPRAVYESATRADLGDLRVFNARDEVVPHALRRVEPGKVPGQWVKAVLFPVRVRAERLNEALDLRFERNAAGSIVRVQTTDKAPAQAPVAFYVVEVKNDKQPLRTLEVDWQEAGGEGFAGRVSIESSEDLKNWRPLNSDAAVMRLRVAGEELDRRKIDLPGVKTKYLRLRWAEPAAAPALIGLRLEHHSDVPPPERLWLRLESSVGEKPGETLYRFNAQTHVDRARIRLPQANAVASVELYARGQRGDAWQRRAAGLVYRVNKTGVDIYQEDLVLVPAAGQREWRLALSQKDGGLGSEAPQLELGWLPQQLVFAARGPGPYRLTYGKAGLALADASVERLLAEKQDGQPKFVAQPARLGEREILGGDKRLALTLGERSWRTWLLWAALGLGVALLGWMAMRLMRQMKTTE